MRGSDAKAWLLTIVRKYHSPAVSAAPMPSVQPARANHRAPPRRWPPLPICTRAAATPAARAAAAVAAADDEAAEADDAIDAAPGFLDTMILYGLHR